MKFNWSMKTIVIHLFMHVKLCRQKLCKKVAFWVVPPKWNYSSGTNTWIVLCECFWIPKKTRLFGKLHQLKLGAVNMLFVWICYLFELAIVKERFVFLLLAANLSLSWLNHEINSLEGALCNLQLWRKTCKLRIG